MPFSSSLSRRAVLAGGQPIGTLMARALAQPELISLAAGFVDQPSLPLTAVDDAWRSLMSDPAEGHAALQYGTTAGYRPLREALLEEQRISDGNPASERNLTPEQVIITSGSNQLLYLLADTLFDPGDIVLCAAPTYFVYLGVAKNLQVRAISVACDEQGLKPDALEDRLREIAARGELRRVKAIYVVSDFDNPRSISLSAERRAEVVAVAKRWSQTRRIYILEDAAYRKLRYSGDDVPSLRAFDEEGDTVILTQTFSKSFSPGVRVGWGIVPQELMGPLCDQKSNIDFGAPNLNQHLMYRVIAGGVCERQVALLCNLYRRKRDAMLAACNDYLAGIDGVHWLIPAGGLYVWLTVSPEIDAGFQGVLFDKALEAGVIYVPGEYSYAPEGEPVARNTLRLSYGVQSPERIREGIRLLATAIRQVRG
ncbi:MAG: PLP-dependent aminotransferase family protein [Planctomycetia bacterium]|nr:PLP-dependent aminotransferase family protein [Planctomycetia bacterium]